MIKHTSKPSQQQSPLEEAEQKFIVLAPNANDLSGQVFGRLTAIGPTGRGKTGVIWLCRCSCGNILNVQAGSLRHGNTHSCGCYQRERASQSSTRHGLTYHPLFRLWSDIIRRCTYPKANNFKIYGGRGIKICDEWRHNFQAFFDYVSILEHCREKGYSLDRIDNDGNYAPGNLRFATKYEQSHNSRRSILITYNGETKCIADWARSVGMKPSMLSGRLRRNMSIEDALSAPSRYKSKTTHPTT